MHGGLTLGLDSIGLRLAVIPAVIDAWFAAHFHSIELGPAPFPLSTRSIRGHRVEVEKVRVCVAFPDGDRILQVVMVYLCVEWQVRLCRVPSASGVVSVRDEMIRVFVQLSGGVRGCDCAGTRRKHSSYLNGRGRHAAKSNAHWKQSRLLITRIQMVRIGTRHAGQLAVKVVAQSRLLSYRQIDLWSMRRTAEVLRPGTWPIVSRGCTRGPSAPVNELARNRFKT
jgi:hypothetical protein